jgi:3-oxoacyl-(acyl-carrier-protein) synthase
MVLEDYETVLARGATIYAEVLGGNVNSRTTWFRNNDSPNPVAVQSAYKMLENAGVGATEIDTINGHLTATTKDSLEIQNCVKPWAEKVKSSPI